MAFFKRIMIVISVNLLIAVGFYYDGIHSNITDISSDLANIIPICKKLDNPNLYQNDLYLSEIEDVEYYTPLYVQSLRFFANFTSGDYLQALNFLSFLTHLLYGVLWFLFFYALRKDYIWALVFSIFFRGVLWPPGGELLGISGLWTIMPRTVFIAVAPLPFLLYSYVPKYRVALSALVLGLLLQIHPISGVGLIVAYFSWYTFHHYFTNQPIRKYLSHFAVGAIWCFIGMLPYLFTYISNISTDVKVDDQLFEFAFRRRISDIFIDPVLFIQSWHRPIFYFLVICTCFFYFVDRSRNKYHFKIIVCSALMVFLTANSFIYIENCYNEVFDKRLRMAFQLIRYQKFILVIFQIALYILIADLFTRLQLSKMYKNILLSMFSLLIILATLPLFSSVPLLGDDLMTSIMPKVVQVNPLNNTTDKSDLYEIISFINENTPKDAVFVGSYLIRAGADRSVQFDSKGAGMLIEGNLKKFVNWYLDEKMLNSLPISQKIIYLKSFNVDYVVTDDDWNISPTYVAGKLKLYKLN